MADDDDKRRPAEEPPSPPPLKHSDDVDLSEGSQRSGVFIPPKVEIPPPPEKDE